MNNLKLFSAPPKVLILGKPKSSHFTLTENSELALVCQVRTNIHKKSHKLLLLFYSREVGSLPPVSPGPGRGGLCLMVKRGYRVTSSSSLLWPGITRGHMSAQGPQTLEPATGTQSLSELIVSFANIFFIFYEFFKNTFNFDLSLMLRKTWVGWWWVYSVLFILDHDRELDKIISRRRWKVIPRMSCHVRILLMSRT